MNPATTAPTGAGAASSLRSSYRAAAVMLGYLLAVKLGLLIAAASGAGFRSPSQAKVFEWWFIGALALIGAGAIWLNHWVHLPGVWDPAIPRARRLTQPVLLGLAFGGAAIAMDVATGWSRMLAATMHLPSIHIPFPSSLLIYPGGAIIVDVLYYLVPITVILGMVRLVSRWMGPPPAILYWVVGAAAAWIEPWTQRMVQSEHPGMTVALFVQGYGLNLLQVGCYRRAGFGAAVVLRIAFYLVWHVLYGALQ